MTNARLVGWGLIGLLLAPFRFLTWLGEHTRTWYYGNDGYLGHRLGDVVNGWELVNVRTETDLPDGDSRIVMEWQYREGSFEKIIERIRS